MSIIKAGRSYRIRNRHSGLYLNVKSNSTAAPARVQQWPMEAAGEQHDAKVWHVFPLDFGAYLFANKNSGLVMNVEKNKPDPSQRLEQYSLQPPEKAPAQTWLIEHVSDETHQVRNQKSNLIMKIYKTSTTAGAEVEQYYEKGAEPEVLSRRWVFEVEDEFPRVLDLPTFDGDIGDVHRMTGFDPTAQETTDPVEVACFAYPFPFITDSSYDRKRQGRQNPYYILRRYGYWKRVYYYQHSGNSEFTHEEAAHVGLTSRNSTTVEETTSTSVSSEASFGFKGFGSSISNTFANEMKVSTTDEEITESWKEVKITRRYPAGLKVSEAIWYREDKYILERLDGSPVIEWTVRDAKTAISDGWPNQALEELRQYRSSLT